MPESPPSLPQRKWQTAHALHLLLKHSITATRCVRIPIVIGGMPRPVGMADGGQSASVCLGKRATAPECEQEVPANPGRHRADAPSRWSAMHENLRLSARISPALPLMLMIADENRR